MSKFHLRIAALTLCQEARGEPLAGQTAVAHVLKNRMATKRWGETLTSVCLWNWHIPAGGQGFQFSGWRGQDPNFSYACGLSDVDVMLIHMLQIMQSVLDSDDDPTGGATHYYADRIEAPTWTVGAVECGKFGSQYFFKGVK